MRSPIEIELLTWAGLTIQDLVRNPPLTVTSGVVGFVTRLQGIGAHTDVGSLPEGRVDLVPGVTVCIPILRHPVVRLHG